MYECVFHVCFSRTCFLLLLAEAYSHLLGADWFIVFTSSLFGDTSFSSIIESGVLYCPTTGFDLSVSFSSVSFCIVYFETSVVRCIYVCYCSIFSTGLTLLSL